MPRGAQPLLTRAGLPEQCSPALPRASAGEGGGQPHTGANGTFTSTAPAPADGGERAAPCTYPVVRSDPVWNAAWDSARMTP